MMLGRHLCSGVPVPLAPSLLTVEYVHRDGGLRVPHAARVVAGVGLGGARDVQSAHRAVLQQVRLDTARVR